MSVVEITHIGEQLVAEMARRSSAVRRTLAPNNSYDDSEVHPELQLTRWGELSFDGAHRLDVAVIDPRDETIHGVELKLGYSRMTSAQFTSRFLGVCGTSHQGKRVKGNIIAILERKFADQLSHPIQIAMPTGSFVLGRQWTLLVRQKTLDSWIGSRPLLSPMCTIVALEKLIEEYGGRTEFNSLVSELIDGDYYREWIDDA